MSSQPPWMEDEKQAPESVVVGTTKPQQMISGQPTMGGNMLYVQDPKFNPETNFRHMSYMVLALAIIVLILASLIGGEDLGYGFCCGIFGIGLMLDAAHYGAKSTWQKERGESTVGSSLGLIADILLGILCIFVALFMLADEFGIF